MNKLILTGSSRCGTTVTRNILNSHPEIYMTNELRVFFDKNASFKVKGLCLYADDPKEYFEALYHKVKRGEGLKYHRIPKNFNFDKFVLKCLKNLKKDTLENRIDAVFKTLTMGKEYTYVGDKGVTPAVLSRLNEEDINYKLIIIYRDGRDATASGIRSKRNLKPPWSANASENADHWARNYKRWFDILDQINNSKYILIKFEDYVNEPAKNFDLISNFLDLDISEFNRSMINANRAHIGYYDKWCPDWEETFSEESKHMLRRLGYI